MFLNQSGLLRINFLSRQLTQGLSSAKEPSVIITQGKHLIKVVLNKPKALNALNLEMIRKIQPRIKEWSQAKNIKAVWVTGAGGKAFCAGGDIKSLYDAKKSGNTENMKILDTFFREEFILDYSLAKMRPVQISVMDGIVMGGGVGISIHSPIRIATESSVFAMPEGKIGFFTDVGGGYFLSRLRSNIGFFLGLTGARLQGKELVQVGVADFFIPREKLPLLEKDLTEKLTDTSSKTDIENIIKTYSEPIERKYQNEEIINEIFNASTFEQIYQNLKSSKNREFADKVAKFIAGQNSISMRVIFDQIKRGKNLDLKDCFTMDFRISQRFMAGNDFFEGVRTVLIDKKDKPKWTYKSPLDVKQEEVDSYFVPLPKEKEIKLD